MKYELNEYDPNPGAGSFVVASDKKFRIQLLTYNVFRFEYSKSGIFEDRPTLTVVNRNFTTNNGIPDFTHFEQDGKLFVLTWQFNITYVVGSALGYPEALRVVCLDKCEGFNGGDTAEF